MSGASTPSPDVADRQRDRGGPLRGMKSGSRRKAECRLWVQKGDDRRNAPQRARCAVTSRSSDEGNRRGRWIATFAATAVIVLINNLWWPR
jgi:hypothetical protein